jgi:hypothetical protein
MDPMTIAAFDLVAAQANGAAPAANTTMPATFDVAHFDALYAAAGPAAQPPTELPKVAGSESQGFRSVLAALENLNGRADTLGALGKDVSKPGDMLMMTMKAQEFMFHCELTSNVANRSSEGVQQLFREQT